MRPPRIFRAPLRSRRDDVDAGAAVERALARGSVGVGGIVAEPPPTLTAAAEAVAEVHGERMARRLERFAAAPDGAFVWTRDADELLWLGRLGGPWRYDAAPEAAVVDLVHVRRCRWLPHPIDDRDVPPRVHVAFDRGGRNWQEIRDPAAAAATAELWEQLASETLSPG